MRQLRCQCGGTVREPLPPACPHCGAKITGVRRKANWFGPLAVALLFVALAAFLYWLVQAARP